MSFQKAECLQTPQVHHNMQACHSRMRRYVPTSSLTDYTSRVISGKGHGQRVVYWLACSARVPKKDVLPLWKECLWYGFSKRRLLSWKLRSCPKASHTALWFIAYHLVGVARKETGRRTSELAFRAPWTFSYPKASLCWIDLSTVPRDERSWPTPPSVAVVSSAPGTSESVPEPRAHTSFVHRTRLAHCKGRSFPVSIGLSRR